MASANQNTVRLSISLGKQEHEALQGLADKNDVSISWLVRKSIERMLDSNPQRDLFKTIEVQEVVRR
jgi:predicted transcriptional regulator